MFWCEAIRLRCVNSHAFAVGASATSSTQAVQRSAREIPATMACDESVVSTVCATRWYSDLRKSVTSRRFVSVRCYVRQSRPMNEQFFIR